MRVLVTGDDGYLGHVVASALIDAGHDVTGWDVGWFATCGLGAPLATWSRRTFDIRDAGAADMEGFEAVVHLAALSNDPLGSIDAAVTMAINLAASVHLARVARRAGVERFVHASSCSVYGVQHGGDVDETSDLRPITPYAVTKAQSERAVLALATAHFNAVALRFGTAYGWAPRVRGDLVANDLTARALTTGQVRLRGDSAAWRPLVHVDDIARSIVAVLGASDEAVRGEVFNVVGSDGNIQIADLAATIHDLLPDTDLHVATDVSPDGRSYRVNGAKLARRVPEAVPSMPLVVGLRDLVEQFRRHGLDAEHVGSATLQRLQCIRELRSSGRLDRDLRWTSPSS